MSFPITSLISEHRELGLVLAVLLGFAFGFVLERAGFGRASKLTAQFYLHDMAVFKVMFSGIITAMLLVLVASGLGWLDLRALSESAVSTTYLGPMVVGGLLLGAGFVISGYCPGTSIVAAASGNIDGIFAFGGVALGSVVFAELLPIAPVLAKFHVSGDKGQLFLYQDGSLGIAAPVLAAIIVVGAVAAFIGAEKVERWRRNSLRGTINADAIDNLDNRDQRPLPRKLVFSGFAAVALVALATVAMPPRPQAATTRTITQLDALALARTVIEAPWSVRIIDLRPEAACVKQRVPGAECVPLAQLAKLNLAEASKAQDLVLVAEKTLPAVPLAARHFPGRVFGLKAGFVGWKRFALTKPAPLAPNATAAQRGEYAFHAAFHATMTGRKAPPPPRAPRTLAAPRRKKKGGGCS